MNNEVYQYADSIIPRNYTICFLELKPFCLGHYTILESLNSPFLSVKDDTSVELNTGIIQFFLCLLICSHSYEDCIQLLDNPKKLKDTIKAYEKALKKNMKKDGDWNIYSKLRLFKDYIAYYTDMPIYSEENKRSEVPSGMDWKQSMFNTFKNEFGYSDSEILNMQLRRMFREWCVYAENNGAIKVVNAWEYQQLQDLKKGNK